MSFVKYIAVCAVVDTMKYIVVLVFLTVYVNGRDEDYFRKLDAIRPEDPCSQVGGICTFAKDCQRLTERSGLCPEQRSQGVECCYGVSKRETRCRRQGGECMNSNCRIAFERATDCEQGQRCCILL